MRRCSDFQLQLMMVYSSPSFVGPSEEKLLVLLSYLRVHIAWGRSFSTAEVRTGMKDKDEHLEIRKAKGFTKGLHL